MLKKLSRCAWVTEDPIYIDYHDNEWGNPVYNDKKLFEFLLLEGAQAGLSWITILKKRENYRRLFDNFNAEKIAKYNEKKILTLMSNPDIIRNRLKIEAFIKNSNAYLKLLETENNFSDFLWQFVDGNPVINRWKDSKKIPVTTSVSDTLSKELKKRGFTFVGSTICYAFMQAVGMVDDHIVSCFRYDQE